MSLVLSWLLGYWRSADRDRHRGLPSVICAGGLQSAISAGEPRSVGYDDAGVSFFPGTPRPSKNSPPHWLIQMS